MTPTIVKAPAIKIGDLIGGRRVRHVTGRQKRSCTASYHSGVGTAGKGNALPSLAFSGHVVVIYFDDGGAPRHLFGTATVEVDRPDPD